jgi:hypothetical protein
MKKCLSDCQNEITAFEIKKQKITNKINICEELKKFSIHVQYFLKLQLFHYFSIISIIRKEPRYAFSYFIYFNYYNYLKTDQNISSIISIISIIRKELRCVTIISMSRKQR